MAAAQIGGGAQSDGPDSANFAVDYDDVAQTVGLSVSTTGSCSQMVVVVTLTGSGQTFSLNCINGPAGNILNQGRKIIFGPGSVVGRNAPVVNLPLPPFPKGSIPPYEFDCLWHQ